MHRDGAEGFLWTVLKENGRTVPGIILFVLEDGAYSFVHQSWRVDLIGKEGKMLTRKRLGILVLALLLAVQGAFAQVPDPNDPNAVDPNAVILPLPLGDALRAVADDLVANQTANDGAGGAGWPGMANYNGSITQGLVSALNIFGDAGYGDAARKASAWLYTDSLFQAPLPDTVLAWAAFGATGGFNTAVWTNTAAWYYDNVKVYTPGGAAAFAAGFGGDASSVVSCLANLTLGAYLVDADEKAIWRAALADALANVTDDTAAFPVQSIGMATWVLATTGPVDPAMAEALVAHQVAADGYDPGSFFWELDHGLDDPNTVAEGYTQDAIFAVLGLYAIADAHPELVPALQAPLINGLKAILGSLGTDGLVYEHLSLGGQASYVYAAQILLLVDVMGLSLDIDLNALDAIQTFKDVTVNDQIGLTLDSPLVWNPSFELPGTVKQKSFEGVVGWTSLEGAVSDSGVETGWGATDGEWTAFLMGGDPGVYQVTQHVIGADDIIQLSVDAKDNWAATTLLIELAYIDGDGAIMPASSANIALTGDMVTSTVVLVAADVPDAVGKELVILLDNVTEAAASWLGLDNVSIDFLAEVPGQ